MGPYRKAIIQSNTVNHKFHVELHLFKWVLADKLKDIFNEFAIKKESKKELIISFWNDLKIALSNRILLLSCRKYLQNMFLKCFNPDVVGYNNASK